MPTSGTGLNRWSLIPDPESLDLLTTCDVGTCGHRTVLKPIKPRCGARRGEPRFVQPGIIQRRRPWLVGYGRKPLTALGADLPKETGARRVGFCYALWVYYWRARYATDRPPLPMTQASCSPPGA